MTTDSKANEFLKEGQDYLFLEPPDYVAAEQCFRKTIELSPALGEAFVLLSAALWRQNKIEEACKTAQEAARLRPSDARPLLYLGYMLHSVGKSGEAIPFFEKALSLNLYGEASARCELANAYESLGQIEKAASLWKQVMTTAPTYPDYDWPGNEARKKLVAHGLLSETQK